MHKALRLAGLLLILLSAACSDRQEPAKPGALPPANAPGAASAASPAPDSSAVDYRAALAAPTRLAGDSEQDARRKPAEVLSFFGVRPGTSVLDLYSGGGYYTELLSVVVGPTGRVVAHNNSAYLEGTKEELARRFPEPPRLFNVERLNAENNALDLEPSRFDFVLMSAVYHDVYFVDEAIGWPKIDSPKLLAEIFAAMKPGATLGLIDHVAAPGSPPETGNTLHRIDPELLKREFAAAGFLLEAESEVLRNPADDLGKGVFDPAVRGHTDRFVLRFRRP